MPAAWVAFTPRARVVAGHGADCTFHRSARPGSQNAWRAGCQGAPGLRAGRGGTAGGRRRGAARHLLILRP